MNAVFVIKILVFIAALIGSRIILARAAKDLTERQREEIAAASTTVFTIRRFLVFGLIAANVFLLTQPIETRESVLPVLTIAFVAIIVLLAIINFFQIKRLNPPKTFVNTYLLSVLVLLIGIVVLFVPV